MAICPPSQSTLPFPRLRSTGVDETADPFCKSTRKQKIHQALKLLIPAFKNRFNFSNNSEFRIFSDWKCFPFYFQKSKKLKVFLGCSSPSKNRSQSRPLPLLLTENGHKACLFSLWRPNQRIGQIRIFVSIQKLEWVGLTAGRDDDRHLNMKERGH